MKRIYLLAMALVIAASACSPSVETSGKSKSTKSEPPPPPCHPGCFPAGTLVATPGGPRAIESIGKDQIITLVLADGSATTGTVHSTFTTCNQLVQVLTESGSLLTTATQPLCLVAGGSCRGGELTHGHSIWRWEQDQRHATRVLGVAPTGQEVPVFNLVVGESAVFVANGFLARGKPPHVAGPAE